MQQSRKKWLSRLAALAIGFVAMNALSSFTPDYSPVRLPGIATIAVDATAAGISASVNAVANSKKPASPAKKLAAPTFSESKRYVYDSLHLAETGLSRKVFEMALRGMEKLKKAKRLHSNILSIVDFSKASVDKRLFVIDLDNDVMLFNTWVAHGRNSGKELANSFSDRPRSNKSSLGFYVTGGTYQGSNGYSLKLLGMEKGFNSNALKRAIVLHGADYVNEDYIQSQGYIGRSQGCPAVKPDVSEPLINSIKDGSCLFIYHPSSLYIKKSALVR